jgi:hypothetical protein
MAGLPGNTGQKIYNSPIEGQQSSVGNQLADFYYQKKALIEARKEQYFMQLADVTGMPKHMGKTIKRFHYLPLLDDANINDQGIDASGAVISNGNLYGSSKDIGTIPGKLPLLSETGGRVNRVGFKRKELEGSIAKFGFFEEYTQESVDFDSDSELRMHINREMINGASQLTEAVLQIDLLTAAGVVRYGGEATQDSEMNGTSHITYGDLMRLSIDLDNNRTPKHTKAFIAVQHYAAGGNTLVGEVGSIDQFRIIVVPEMLKWAGKGADAGEDADHYTTNGKFDVFPMLVVGDGSFTTIGFQTDGKTVKFKIYHKAPGEATADRNDPYGETGFMSIKWYYGFMVLRPERLAVAKTTAIL